jgi:hypothetical protein
MARSNPYGAAALDGLNLLDLDALLVQETFEVLRRVHACPPRRANKHTNKQTNKQTLKQTNTQTTNERTNKRTNRQTNERKNKQTNERANERPRAASRSVRAFRAQAERVYARSARGRVVSE